MAELLRLSKKNRERLSAKDRKALDSARSAIEMKIKVQKDASKGGKTQIAKNLQSQIDRAISRFNKNITKYRKTAITVSPPKDIDEDVAGRDRPIKSPADPSGLESGRGMPKKKKKVKKTKVGTPAFSYGARTGRGVWDSGKLTKKDLANLVGQEALDFPKSLPKSRRRGPLADTSYAAILGDVDPSRHKGWKKPEAGAKPRRRGPLADTSYAAILGDVDPSRHKGWKKPKPPATSKPPVTSTPPAKPPVVSDKPKPKRKPTRQERYPSRADPDLGIGGVSRRIKTTQKPVDKAKKTKKAKELSGLEQFWEDVKKLPKYLGTDLLPEQVSGPKDMRPAKRGYKWEAPFVGEVEFELDTTTADRKKGGRIKKGVKKTKTRKPKVRRRAALRGHRAERRGG